MTDQCFTESGILIFTLLDGDLARPNCYLEVVMDDMVFPSFTSNKVRSRHHEFNESKFARTHIWTNTHFNQLVMPLFASLICLKSPYGLLSM
jgi:Ca2+-dependent lipid-binding protein